MKGKNLNFLEEIVVKSGLPYISFLTSSCFIKRRMSNPNHVVPQITGCLFLGKLPWSRSDCGPRLIVKY